MTACWVFFGIMSLAFLPLGFGIMQLHALPTAPRLVLAFLVVGALWWGPFGYAMYLALAVLRNGDRRLLQRGIHGTAEVLSAKETNTVIQAGEFAWQAPRVWKYGLRVSIPGQAPYETACSICAAGISEGSVVNVAVSPHNRHRVTIDVGQGSKDGAQAPRPVPGHGAVAGAQTVTLGGLVDQSLAAGAQTVTLSDLVGQPAGAQTVTLGGLVNLPTAEAQRIGQLAQLGQLHRQGVLTDSEFEAQKAEVLGQ
jgi:hypothetical protein